MNRSTAAAMLRRGKHLAPDRFQAIPRDDAGAVALLDAWVDALAYTANSPTGLYLVPEPPGSATAGNLEIA